MRLFFRRTTLPIFNFESAEPIFMKLLPVDYQYVINFYTEIQISIFKIDCFMLPKVKIISHFIPEIFIQNRWMSWRW